MSRYYDLLITDPKTNKIVRRWTTHPNGPTQAPDMGALSIEFDVIVSGYGDPYGTDSSISVEGVALADLSQAQQFAGMNISLVGGMGKGLPLANPKQAGVLVSGNIFQSFGNWQGTEMCLEFVIQPSGINNGVDAPLNFSFSWQSGVPCAGMIAQVLKANYPNIKQNISITPGLVLPTTEAGSYNSLRTFSQFVLGITADPPNYSGVQITIQGGEFFVFDGTQKTVTVPLQFNDLVGQPTWIDVNQIQVRTVLRGDIQVGNTITMPTGLHNVPGVVTTTPASQPSNSKYQSAFQGGFNVYQVRHIGNSRVADGGQWITVLNCTTDTVR